MSQPSFSNKQPRVGALSLLTAIIGVGLLAFTIRQVGWAEVRTGIASIGWAFLMVVALGAARMACRARAWMVCANDPADGIRQPADGIRQQADGGRRLTKSSANAAGETHSGLQFGAAFGAILAADALGNLTPLGLLASEPAKVMLVRSRISTIASVASVTIENACYTASVVLVLLTGTWMFLQRATVPPILERAAQVVVVGAVVAGAVGAWAARTRPVVLSRIAPIVGRLVGKSATSRDTLREVEVRIYDALRWPLRRLGRVAVWEALFHVCAVVEVWLVLRLLPGGVRISLTDAFLMESAGRFVTVAFKFIPYRLGVDEAGSGAVAQLLGLGAATGVTLALVRRLRILCLNAAGLFALARRN